MEILINNDLNLSSSDENLIMNLMRVIMNLIMCLINNFDNDESSDYFLKDKMVF